MTVERTAAPDLAPFSSRWGRRVAFGVAALVLSVLVVLAVTVPTAREGSTGGWHLLDRVLLVLFALLVSALICQFGLVKAVPDDEGLLVRNLFQRQRVHWAEIVGVHYGPHQPWAILELADTERLPVMAIQRADGARGAAEAKRLARLIRDLGSAAEPVR